MTLADAVQFFLNACELEENLSPRTIAAYVIDIRQFQIFCDARGVEELSRVDCFVLQSHVSDLKHSLQLRDSSIRRKIAVLRRFFNLLEQRDMISSSPFRRTNFSFKQASRVPQVLNRQEVNSILCAAKAELKPNSMQQIVEDQISRDLFVACRDQAILEVLFYTGARVGEIVQLDVEDCDLTNARAKFKGKGRRERIVYIECGPVIESLKLYLKVRPKLSQLDSALFLSSRARRLSVYTIENMVARFAIQAGVIKRVTPHTFRHTMATMMLENGADIRTVQQILGHSSIRTTQIYTHISNEQSRRVMGNCHPRNLLWF